MGACFQAPHATSWTVTNGNTLHLTLSLLVEIDATHCLVHAI